MIGCTALAACAIVAASWVYAASELHMRSFASPPPFVLAIPEDAASIARGDHLVRTRGCRGCHGAALEGEMNWGVAAAPNLAAYARDETPATFERALRHGIGRDGRGLYSMPSYNFVHLRDDDVAAIIAYLRSIPVAPNPPLRDRMPLEIRLAIARGEDDVMPAWLSSVPPLQETENPDVAVARGEYLAMTSCNECHGFTLRADAPWGGGSAPDLIAMIAAYPEADFRVLMREGVPIGGRELEMMGGVARGRFAYWSDDEVGDLYAYLRMRADRLMEEGR
jgi:mono/diheme cytochrome c family protein